MDSQNTMSAGRWNRGELLKWCEHFVELNGSRMMRVNAAYTSQTCHICGARGSVKRWHTFVCTDHGTMDRDENAAANIALRLVDAGTHAKCVATRKKAKRYTRRHVQRSRVHAAPLRYPGRKNHPTPKRPKGVKHIQHPALGHKVPRVHADVSAKHTTDRTLERRCVSTDRVYRAYRRYTEDTG